MDLNVESSADNGTEYTQDEYDIKKIVFPEQETSPESSLCSSLVNNEGCGNRKVDNCSSAKYLKVDNWLQLHKKEPTISGSSHQSKRVLAIPVPEKKHTCNGQKKDKLQDTEEHYYKIETENIANLEKPESVNMKGSGRSIQKVTKIDTAPILEDFVNKDSRCDLICASDKTDGDIIKHAKGSLHGQSLEESKTDYPNQDNNPVNKWLEMQEAKDERECSNYFWSNNNERSQHSKNDVDYRMLDAREDSGLSISISEQEPYSPQVPADIGLKDGQSSAVGSKPSILEMRSQRALFAGKAKPKDLFTTMVKSKDNTKNSGIYRLLKEKIQILWATALLGMGFQTVGLEHDFFHGLML